MTPTTATVILAALALLGQLANYLLNQKIRADLLALELRIAQQMESKYLSLDVWRTWLAEQEKKHRAA